VSPADEPTASPQPGPRPQGSSQEDDPLKRLGELQKNLGDLLRPILKVWRDMDANSANAHQQVEEAYEFICEKIFVVDGPLDPERYDKIYQLFENAWQEENEKYEPYEGALETHNKRRGRDLTVAEAGVDLEALGGFRKKYIFAVRDFHAQMVAIEDYLTARIAPPQKAPAPGSGYGSG
jgi:hypothetical protein